MSSEAHPIVGSSGPERASGLVVLALMLVAFGLVVGRVVQIASGPPPPRAGASAPAFEAPTPDGAARISLESLRGKVVLVDFWATWCPPCVASMPVLERLHQRLGPKGFTVIGVNAEAGEEATVRAFLRDEGLTLPVVMDDGRIAARFGVFSYPTSFLVGRDGAVRSVHRGVAREAALEAEIEAALAEAQP